MSWCETGFMDSCCQSKGNTNRPNSRKLTFKQFVTQLRTSYFSPMPVAENPLMLWPLDPNRCGKCKLKKKINKSFTMTLSIYLNSAPVQGQKEMSFFDGIFPHCLWMMITLLSQIKPWLLNYIILIIHSYQSGPGPVLPARIVLCAGCNHYFLKDKEVAKVQHSYIAGSTAGSHSRIVFVVIWLSGLNAVQCKLNMEYSHSVYILQCYNPQDIF